MKNHEQDTATDKKQMENDSAVDPTPKAEEPQNESAGKPQRLLDRMRRLFNSAQRPPAPTRDFTKDRTRSLLLLIGGTVGAVVLFIAVFSTPPRASLQETRSQRVPNFGRPIASPSRSSAPRGSVTPLLNADVRSTDLARDQLSPADISSTSRRSVDTHETIVPPAPPPRTSGYRSAIPPARPPVAVPPADAADPLVQYRIDDGAGAPTYRYGVPLPSDSGPRASGTFSYGGTAAASRSNPSSASSATRSSIVFVREGRSASVPQTNVRTAMVPSFDDTYLLPPGTRLMARIDAATISVLQTPVVASIEYNYERDGTVVVPAGTKVIGEIRQASAEGHLDVRFHTLQVPDGSDARIEGTAMSLDLKPLKGTVSGKNTGKKIVSRTLSGIGTVAAYMVGGGSGLSSSVTGETLLRDRVASNIALAGEEQLRNAAYSQNIAVTLPANTRLYVVLQKTAAGPPAQPAVGVPESRVQGELPTVQELRELIDLRREINRMYQDSNGNSGGVPQ